MIEDLQVVHLPEEPRAGEQLEEHHPQGEHVGPGIELLGARLLRRHVGDLPLQLPARGLLAGDLGDAEVDQLDRAVGGDQQVLRADVTVDDAARLAAPVGEGVGVVEPLGRPGDQLHGHRHRHGLLELARRLVDPGHALTLDELHHDVEGALVFTQLVDLHHVPVREPRGEARLREEHLHVIRVVLERADHPLDDDDLLEAVQPGLPRQPDLGHAAGGQRGDQDIATELSPGEPMRRRCAQRTRILQHEPASRREIT